MREFPKLSLYFYKCFWILNSVIITWRKFMEDKNSHIVRSACHQVKIQSIHDLCLFVQYLSLVEFSMSNLLDKSGKSQKINLLEFWDGIDASDSNNMHLVWGLWWFLCCQILIHQINCFEITVIRKFIGCENLDQPVDHPGSERGLNLVAS